MIACIFAQRIVKNLFLHIILKIIGGALHILPAGLYATEYRPSYNTALHSLYIEDICLKKKKQESKIDHVLEFSQSIA
jgi:hypothetical protein